MQNTKKKITNKNMGKYNLKVQTTADLIMLKQTQHAPLEILTKRDVFF